MLAARFSAGRGDVLRSLRAVAWLGLLVPLAGAPAAEAAFPGANGRIAYAQTGQPGGPPALGVVTVAPDGSAQTSVGGGGQPDWSPDGRRLALVVGRGERPSLLYVQAADGSHRRRVRLPSLGRYTRGPTHPRWTADGRHIVFLAFTKGEEPRSALFRVRTDGRGRRLVRRFARNMYVSFAPSPDGRRIAFSEVVRNPNAIALFAMPASGGHALRLATLGAAAEPPGRIDWSPDSARVTFDGDGVQMAQADGGGLTSVAADGREPTFSPDGRQVAFVHFSATRSEGSYPTVIDVATPDGSDRHTVATDARGVAWPTWQPLPAG
jgi:Tol biopolymer transport system component